MTHQDVAVVIAADLVERLRNWDHGIPKTMIVSEAADFIESQAKALRDAEELLQDYEGVLADKRQIARDIDIALHGGDGAARQASLCDLVEPARRLKARALAAESRIAEAMRVIEQLRDWLILAGDLTCREVPLGIARDFLNAKEKT